MHRLTSLFLIIISVSWSLASANAAVICNFYETSDGRIRVDYSGSFDTSKFSNFIVSNYNQGASTFSAQSGYFRVGQFVDFYTTDSTPNPGTPLGTGGQVILASVTPGSSAFAFDFVGKTVYVPVGYVSNTPITGSAVINGSLSYLGMKGGTYSYSWAGGSEGVTLVVHPSPEPATISIFAIGSMIAGWRIHRKRKTQA